MFWLMGTARATRAQPTEIKRLGCLAIPIYDVEAALAYSAVPGYAPPLETLAGASANRACFPRHDQLIRPLRADQVSATRASAA